MLKESRKGSDVSDIQNRPLAYRLSYVGWVEFGSNLPETVMYDLIPRGVTFWSDCVHPNWIKKVCGVLSLITERTVANYTTIFPQGSVVVGYSETDKLFYRRRMIVKEGVIVDVGEADEKQDRYDVARTPRIRIFKDSSIEQVNERLMEGLDADVVVIAFTQSSIFSRDKSAFVKAISEFSIRRQTLLLFESPLIKDELRSAFEDYDYKTNVVHRVMSEGCRIIKDQNLMESCIGMSEAEA